MPKPAPEVTDAEAKSLASKAMIRLQVFEGDHRSTLAVIRAQGCTQLESLVWPEA